ncbi:hypothetical protein P3S67_007379 [Capsicum chacoense]
MKSTKMKEVLLRKRLEFEKICRKSHMVIGTQNSAFFSVETIDSGRRDSILPSRKQQGSLCFPYTPRTESV